MYYNSSSLLNPQIYIQLYITWSYIIISPGNDGFLFAYCIPSLISVLFAHLTSLGTKTQSKLLKQAASSDYSYQRSFMARPMELVRFDISKKIA